MKERFEELVEYFKENYFNIDFSGIKNYDMTDVTRFFPLMIVGLCLGVFVAACIYYYHSHYIGSVVRALYRAGAFSAGDAKTLSEVNCNKFAIKRALKRENLLTRYVKKADGGEEDRYFIPEDDKYIAEKRFKEVRGGIFTLVLIFFICFFGCLGLLLVAPQILQLADNVVTMMKS